MSDSNRRPRRIRAAASVLALCVFSGASAALAGSAPELRYDPFRSPPAEAPRTDSPARGSEPITLFTPVLRSTIVGGSQALVNLGGEVLAVGEEAHGYRLLAVGLYEAVFEKDGRRIQLEVHSERDPSP